jgi:hypothetical protein
LIAYKARTSPIAYLILVASLFGIFAPSLSAAPETAGTQAVSVTKNSTRKLLCESSRAQYVALTCERKVAAMPTSSTSLDIPRHYSTKVVWEGNLLRFAQELYGDEPKDLQASASTVLQSCMSRCSYAKLCQDEVFEHFEISSGFLSKLSMFLSERSRDSRRNDSLAAALGESLYKSDAGELINRHTDIKICGELKAEAKKDQCDLSATAKK